LVKLLVALALKEGVPALVPTDMSAVVVPLGYPKDRLLTLGIRLPVTVLPVPTVKFTVIVNACVLLPFGVTTIVPTYVWLICNPAELADRNNVTGEPATTVFEDGNICSHDDPCVTANARFTGMLLVVVRLTDLESPPPTNVVLSPTGFTSTPRTVLPPPPPPPPPVLLPRTEITFVSVGVCVSVTFALVQELVPTEHVPVSVKRKVAGVTPRVPLTCCTVNHPAEADGVTLKLIGVPSLLLTSTVCWVCPSDERVIELVLVVRVCADAAPANSSATARKGEIFFVV
jgi:hypothetical protein